MDQYVIRNTKVEAFIDSINWRFVVPSHLDEIDAGRAMHIEARRLADHVEQTAYEQFKRSYTKNREAK